MFDPFDEFRDNCLVKIMVPDPIDAMKESVAAIIIARRADTHTEYVSTIIPRVKGTNLLKGDLIRVTNISDVPETHKFYVMKKDVALS